MSRSALPFDLQIASPCTQSWDEMCGSLTQRHCASCNKQVHNLAALTPRQIERLVVETGGHLCAQLTRRSDGSLVTAEQVNQSNGYAKLALTASLALTPSIALAQATPESKLPTIETSGQPDIALTEVYGVVSDNQRGLIVGVPVSMSLRGSIIGSTHTNEAGQFAFAVLPGEYRLDIVAPGFARTSKVLTIGTTNAEIGDISLTPGTEVTVEVTASLSEITSTTGGALAVSYSHWYKRWGYRARHPIAYTKYLFRPR